jgi:hypothetical protein
LGAAPTPVPHAAPISAFTTTPAPTTLPQTEPVADATPVTQPEPTAHPAPEPEPTPDAESAPQTAVSRAAAFTLEEPPAHHHEPAIAAAVESAPYDPVLPGSALAVPVGAAAEAVELIHAHAVAASHAEPEVDVASAGVWGAVPTHPEEPATAQPSPASAWHSTPASSPEPTVPPRGTRPTPTPRLQPSRLQRERRRLDAREREQLVRPSRTAAQPDQQRAGYAAADEAPPWAAPRAGSRPRPQQQTPNEPAVQLPGTSKRTVRRTFQTSELRGQQQEIRNRIDAKRQQLDELFASLGGPADHQHDDH